MDLADEFKGKTGHAYRFIAKRLWMGEERISLPALVGFLFCAEVDLPQEVPDCPRFSEARATSRRGSGPRMPLVSSECWRDPLSGESSDAMGLGYSGVGHLVQVWVGRNFKGSANP